MMRLLAFLLFALSLVLIVRSIWLHTDAQRKQSIGVGLLAAVLIAAGLLMIAFGG